jgi:hypothetical protein
MTLEALLHRLSLAGSPVAAPLQVLPNDVLRHVAGGDVKCSAGNSPNFVKCEWSKAV